MSDKLTTGAGPISVEHTTDAQGRRVARIEETTTATVKPNHQPRPGPIANAQGIIVPDTEANPHGDSAPPIAGTPEEAGWWGRWGGAIHTGLDLVGLIPVVGEIADGANALIYLAEGDAVNAALSAAAMVPGAGMAATGAKLGKKAAGAVAEGAAKGGRQAAEEGAKRTSGGGRRNNGGKDKGKKKGPCDHLKKGNANGTGSYRGGSYGGTKKSGIESHHAPANSASPLPRSQGPAIQMAKSDHRSTSSHGHQGADGALYRAELEELISRGLWDEVMAIEVEDIRRVASESGNSEIYDEAINEMLDYYNCLKQNGLLR